MAQNWVNAGNNLNAPGKLGTTSNQPISLITNNSERARITNGGNFGIGTGTPITKFHVNCFGSFGNQVTTANATRAFNLADNNAVLRVLRVDASKAPAVELISRTSADGKDVAYWDFYAQPSDASFRIRDRKTGGSGLDRIIITHLNGFVGIGTNAPTAKLEVTGSTTFGAGTITSGYDYGLKGFSTGEGIAVFGQSDHVGVYGIGANFGTYGYSELGKGAYGYSNTGSGVYGNATNGNGVYGFSSKSYGGKFESYDGSALIASTTNGFYAGLSCSLPAGDAR